MWNKLRELFRNIKNCWILLFYKLTFLANFRNSSLYSRGMPTVAVLRTRYSSRRLLPHLLIRFQFCQLTSKFLCLAILLKKAIVILGEIKVFGEDFSGALLTTNIHTRIVGGQWRHKYGHGLSVYIHIWQIRDFTNRQLFKRGYYPMNIKHRLWRVQVSLFLRYKQIT